MLDEMIVVPEVNEEIIESMIYIVRGQKVMLDFELAKIYGYETKRFNEQVKNNIEKFDDDFRFKLSKEEYLEILRSKKSTARTWIIGNKGGRTTLPYVFTEQGIYMLMTVLKGELAIKQSKALIRMFKGMKDYLIENKDLLNYSNYLFIMKSINENNEKIKNISEKFINILNNFSKGINRHYLILNGEKIESDIAYQNIYESAIYSIYIIDDYIDIKTFLLLKSANQSINIIIFTDNRARNNLNNKFINDFISDTGFNIIIKKNNNRFHDRYIVIDFNTENEVIYHCGASSKDAGNKITTIIKIDEIEIYNDLLNKILNNEILVLE